MNKKLFILTIVIIILGIFTNLSKIFYGSFDLFVIGLFILSMIPYITYFFLSSWNQTYWISLIIGLVILGLDVEAHMSVFVYPNDAQAPLVLIFSPIAIFVVCIVSFIVLALVDNIIYYVRNKCLKLKLDRDTKFKQIFIKYITPIIGIVCVYIAGIALITSPSLLEKPIHQAISYGELKDVEKVVESGADIEALSYSGETPLFAATGAGKVDIIDFLISKGAKINFIDKKLDMSPLMWACSINQDKSAIFLINNGADLNLKNSAGYTPLRQCVDENRTEVVKEIIKAGSDINETDKQGQTPLMVAAMSGSKDSTKLLIDSKADLNIQDKTGFTALHWAAYYGYKDIVKALLEAGADKNITSKIGKTPLDYARMNKFPKVVKVLESNE